MSWSNPLDFKYQSRDGDDEQPFYVPKRVHRQDFIYHRQDRPFIWYIFKNEEYDNSLSLSTDALQCDIPLDPGRYMVGIFTMLETTTGKELWVLDRNIELEVPSANGWVQWRTQDGGNGHWYKPVAVESPISWLVASNAAAAGGYLATLTSAEENDFVFALVDDDQYYSSTVWWAGPWVGGFQPDGAPEPAGGWTWVTGEAWNYTHWDQGEPSNNYGDGTPENALHLTRFRGHNWNDFPAVPSHGDVFSYVIERNDAP